MTLDESVHGMRLRVIERAQVQGNVSAVCRELGISRTVFYRWRQRLERYGVDGVHPRRHFNPHRPTTADRLSRGRRRRAVGMPERTLPSRPAVSTSAVQIHAKHGDHYTRSSRHWTCIETSK